MRDHDEGGGSGHGSVDLETYAENKSVNWMEKYVGIEVKQIRALE